MPTLAAAPVRLYTTSEVATALRCSTKRVRELAASGVLHPVRFSPQGRMRFPVAEVERLISGEVKSP